MASRAVIDHLASFEHPDHERETRSVVAAAVVGCTRVIADLQAAEPALRGMGTTLTFLLLAGDRIAPGHVGDSRAYLWRDGDLARLTRDDTFVQAMVDRGLITPGEALAHPSRSKLLKAVQAEPVEPLIATLRGAPDDRYLLCCDGLTDVVTEPAIAAALHVGAVQDAARGLVDLALRARQRDLRGRRSAQERFDCQLANTRPTAPIVSPTIVTSSGYCAARAFAGG